MPVSPGKVLIIVENLPVPFDRRVWMESTTLAAAGYTVSIICPIGKGYEKTFEVIDGIHIYRHPLPAEESSPLGYIREYFTALRHEFRLARRVKKERGFGVIHACNPPDLIFLVALWFKLLYGTKFLFDQHNLNPELYESKFLRRDVFYHGLRFAERCTFAAANLVICTNESYRAVALSRGRKRPDRVFVVRSGPRLDIFNPVPPLSRYKRNKAWLVGYLGVMGEFDGVDHLVRAAHELIANRGRQDIAFCFVGSGPMLESLKAMAVKLGIDSAVEFTGRVSDTEMIERICTCDVCVDCDPLNPLNNVSTMNKVLEYMALKRPIVQYDLIEGRRSALDASVYAQPNDVMDLADKIEALLGDPNLRKSMGEFGRSRMENELEWKHQAPHLLAAYDALLNPRSA